MEVAPTPKYRKTNYRIYGFTYSVDKVPLKQAQVSWKLYLMLNGEQFIVQYPCISLG